MADDASSLKHRFTWDEVSRLAAANVFGETTRVELIAGDIFTMPEEGYLHVDAVHALQRFLLDHVAPLGLGVFIREPVHFAEGGVLIPDLCVFPAGTTARTMQTAHALLIVEVSDTTLAYDRDVKSPRYAAGGAAELWIVDARARAISVQRTPLDGVWSYVNRVSPGQTLAPLCAATAVFDPEALPIPEIE